MKKTLTALLLSFSALGWASAQQAPTVSPARVLTPAEQRQKEKIEREIQRERQIRAEWVQKQRDYEAKQAEKERQRLAKKAGKEAPAPEPVKSRETPAATTATNPVSQPSVTEAAPAVAEPARKAKKEKQPKTKSADVTPAPVVRESATMAPAPTPVETARERRQRTKRERTAVVPAADSTAGDVEMVAKPTVSRASREFLPKGHLFEPILLDPLEAQTYGSFLPGYWTEGQKYKGSIVPFAFGFAKPFYRHTTEPGRAEEWVLDLASFTQFEAFHDDQANAARRRIVNTDYKISIIYNIRRGDNNYRIRVYHLSSHLGDDYIFRNKITAPSPNAVNYELLDFTYSRVVNNIRLYGGAGVVLRKTEERKPLSAQLGAFYKRPSDKAARLVGGVDVKFWQQTDFRPGIHGGVGIELGRTQNNLTFLLEGYSGFRPYSQYEDQQTSWIGIGLYLNPF